MLSHDQEHPFTLKDLMYEQITVFAILIHDLLNQFSNGFFAPLCAIGLLLLKAIAHLMHCQIWSPTLCTGTAR